MALVVLMTVAVAIGVPGLLVPRRRRVAPVRLDPYLHRLQRLSDR